jgi:peptidoglycan/xylan/chitin deacetylase (PgdA/CDA1 family)
MNLIKNRKLIFVVFVFSFVILQLKCQYVNEIFTYEYSPFKDNKVYAASLTFDDNSIGQFRYGLPILNKYNIPATFFVITGRVNDTLWNKFPEMIKTGHEIGSHTVNHPNLQSIIIDSIRDELAQSKDTIEKRIPGYKCISLAYPYGQFNFMTRLIASDNYLAARTLVGGSNEIPLHDFYQINGTGINSKTDSLNYDLLFKNQIPVGSWKVFVYHGIDYTGYDPVNDTVLERYCMIFTLLKKRLWVATFGDVVKYQMLRENTDFNIFKSSDKSIECSLNTLLDTSFYNFPLSLRLILPTNWHKITVTQNDSNLEYDFLPAQNSRKIVFNVFPNRGKISITADSVSQEPAMVIEQNTEDLQVRINNSFVEINYKDTQPVSVDLHIYDLKGISIYSTKRTLTYEQTAIYDISRIPQGFYVLDIGLRNQNKNYRKKSLKFIRN